MKLRTLSLCLVLIMATFLAGCGDLISVEPLATDSNSTFDPTLLGTWSDLDVSSSVIVYVREGEKRSYDILWLDIQNGEATHMQARLAQIGGQRILDMTSASGSNPVFTISGHAFVRVNNLENGLQFRFLDSDWLQGKAQESKLPVHSQGINGLLFTGSTEQLQDFMLQYGVNDQAQSEPISLRRLK
jgi:hypothetical protein